MGFFRQHILIALLVGACCGIPEVTNTSISSNYTNTSLVCAAEAAKLLQNQSRILVASFIAFGQHDTAQTQYWKLAKPLEENDGAIIHILFSEDPFLKWKASTKEKLINTLAFLLIIVRGKNEQKCEVVQSFLSRLNSKLHDESTQEEQMPHRKEIYGYDGDYPRSSLDQTKNELNVNMLELASELKQSCKVNPLESIMNSTITKLVPKIQKCKFAEAFNLLKLYRDKAEDFNAFYRLLIQEVFAKNVSNFDCLARMNQLLQLPHYYGDPYTPGDSEEPLDNTYLAFDHYESYFEIQRLHGIHAKSRGAHWLPTAVGWQTILQELNQVAWDEKGKNATIKLANGVKYDLEESGEQILNGNASEIYEQLLKDIPKEISAIVWGTQCTIQNKATKEYLVASNEGNIVHLKKGSLKSLGYKGYWLLQGKPYRHPVQFYIKNLDWQRGKRYLCAQYGNQDDKQGAKSRLEIGVETCYKTAYGSNIMSTWWLNPRNETGEFQIRVRNIDARKDFELVAGNSKVENGTETSNQMDVKILWEIEKNDNHSDSIWVINCE